MQRTLALGLMLVATATAFSACERESPPAPPPTGWTRFQVAATQDDIFMLDAATGDLWKLEEAMDGAHWQHHAEAPGDVKPIDPDSILHPPRPEEAGEPAEEPHDDENHDEENADGQ